MASISRLRVAWSGNVVVGPGLSTFYFATGSPTNAPSVVTTFFTAIRSMFPAGLTWTVPDGGDLIEESSGSLTGTWTGDAGGTVTSSSTGNFAQGVGARVSWMTDAIRGGRRVRGTTFLVPLRSSQWDDQGTLDSAGVTTLSDAANALMANADWNLLVWSRPRPGLSGLGVPVARVEIPDKISWLRSRKT